MIEPSFATIVMIVTAVLLLIIIPWLDGSDRFGKYISLRYTLVSVVVIMALGCILDFSHLGDSSRNIVLMGSLILVGIFVAVRSLEKCKLGSKLIKLDIHKGDAGASVEIGDNKNGKKEKD